MAGTSLSLLINQIAMLRSNFNNRLTGRELLPPVRANQPLKWLCAFLLLAIVLNIPLKSIAQTITWSGRQITLQQVFAEVKKQTGYTVVFNPELVDVQTKVTVKAKDQPLEAFMKTVFNGKAYTHTIVGTTVVVTRKPVTGSKTPLPDSTETQPSGREINGIVLDEKTFAVVPGVTVITDDGAKGTQTNEKGLFTLKNAADKVTLIVTCIGYEKAIVTADKTTPLVYVHLKVSTSQLDQAVIQGYGTTSKRLATGNIAKITAEEIARQPVMNPLQALQGRVPGLIVTHTRGYASSPLTVEIRGRNSLNKQFLSEPLYVIDGVPQTILDVKGSTRYNSNTSPGFAQGGASATNGQSPLFSINPKDIESIEVLKDGDATAIYGSRAANGVILITTKKGMPGKTSFSLNISKGVVTVPRYLEMLNTQEYVAMRLEAFKNDGIPVNAASAPDLAIWDTTRYTNWQREIISAGSETSISAGLSGGDNRVFFNLNTNYTKQTDLMTRNGGNQRATLSFNLRHRSTNQKLNVVFGVKYGYTKVDAISDRTSAFTLAPNAPSIFNEKGNLNFQAWNEANMLFDFPFTYLLKPATAKTQSLNSNLNISYQLVKGLTLNIDGGYTFMQSNNVFLTPIASQNPLFNPSGSAVFGKSGNNNWIIEPQLRYSRMISKGTLSMQAGATLQNTSTSGTTIMGMGYTNDALLHSIANAPVQRVMEGISEYKYAAVFGRVNYNWGSKYVLNLNVRRDGSSRFAPGSQFGNFGSVGATWIMSEENWMRSTLPSWLSLIKLRGSYALTGNDAIGDYQYLSQWSGTQPYSFTSSYAYDGINPFVPIHAVNQNYRWEELRQLEGALILGFLEDKVNLEVAVYRKRSGNQLTNYPTPQYTGFQSVTANWDAVVQNSGLEATLLAKLVQQKDFSWNFNFNIGSNRNKLISFPGLASSPYATQYKIGESLGAAYVLHYLRVDPQTGDYVYEDYNKDGKVTNNFSVVPGTGDDDRYVAVDLNPSFAGGFGSDFRYRNFSLSLFFDFIKQMGAHPFATVTPGRMSNLVMPKEVMEDHWRKPGDIATYARFSTIAPNTLLGSDGGYIDASFLRFKNVSFSYALPEKLVKKARMQSCNFSINVQNLWTITRYNIDPELQNASLNPIPRIMTCNLSFNF
jgi:TonB-linked SusC/RagA family outer membrane protein